MRAPFPSTALFLSAGLLWGTVAGCSEQPDAGTSRKSSGSPAGSSSVDAGKKDPKTKSSSAVEPAPGSKDLSAAADGSVRREDGPTSKPREAQSAQTDSKPLLSAEDVADGWIALFDGTSLFGWKPNSDANWSVRDGVLSADSGKPGMLMTTVRFADFELRCDYRLARKGNSGIFLRSVFEPKDPAKDCYELNMCDTHPSFGTGSLVARAKPEKSLVGEDGEWHSFHVRCEGTKITADFDGKPVLEFDDTTENVRRDGLIGLQMNGGKIEFRNVFLKPLGTQSLFNGKDLAGWRVVPGSKSAFDVKDGAIHVENGTGFLETEATFGDFVLQGQARTNGEGLNSGVFFRAMPGTKEAPSNGYEFQIHNAYRDNDRTKPVDSGTGAIFRRVAARTVVSNDREWFTFTLVADGANFATWVDGYPVVAWTDDREADENPRKGKRLDAGHLSLQGHDATTNLDFRALRAVELPSSKPGGGR